MFGFTFLKNNKNNNRNLVSLFTCSSVCVEGHGKPHVESVGARLQEALSRKQSTESSRFSFVGGYPAFLKQLPAKMT